MDADPTLASLIEDFARRGDHPAIIAVRGEATESWSFAELADSARRLAAGLMAAGTRRGAPVALIAPNGPEWAAAYFATVLAGALAVPLDERIADEDLAWVIRETGCRRIFAAAAHLERLRAIDGAEGREITLLEDDDADGARSWRRLAAAAPDRLPALEADEPASLLFTSGTTGAPKGVPLTHRNFLTDLDGLLRERLVDSRHRVLLPLPLYHAYPFTVGLLAPLASGASVVIPDGISGPQIMHALRATGATTIVGVPRLYSAMVAGIEARAKAAGPLAARAFRLVLDASIWARRRLGVRFGRIVFARVRKAVAPRLQLLGSGGAHLPAEVAWTLEGLGWEVLTGYGLTETAPILTFNPRGRARLDSVGLPIPGVEIRTAPAREGDFGEVEARGPNVFAGYWREPEMTRECFTEDGWLRTGDLGVIDADGYLRLVGRARELIVLPGGKNVFPDRVEAVYGESPFIGEVAVLEREGRLVALVVPDKDAVRARGEARVDALLREQIEALSHKLPPYQRLSGYAVTREALPRTNLGKLRRHLLPDLYEQAKRGTRPRQAAAPSAEDEALLAEEPARSLWRWLQDRFPDQALDLETSPQLDLGVDSLEWVTLTLELEEAFGIRLTEDAVGRISTLRDFLEEAAAAREAGGEGEGAPAGAAALTARQKRWLEPRGPLLTVLGAVIYAGLWVLMRGVFRLRVEGAERLPAAGPVILAPNHVSYLDSLALAVALGWRRLSWTHWAGWAGLMFKGPLWRLFSRTAQVFPLDPDRSPALGLASGLEVLRRDKALVWFPEGRRSPDGRLLAFLPGVGRLAAESGARAVPVLIRGTFEALPFGRRWPRPHPVTIVFGAPADPAALAAEGEGADEASRIANALHDRLADLAREAAG